MSHWRYVTVGPSPVGTSRVAHSSAILLAIASPTTAGAPSPVRRPANAYDVAGARDAGDADCGRLTEAVPAGVAALRDAGDADCGRFNVVRAESIGRKLRMLPAPE